MQKLKQMLRRVSLQTHIWIFAGLIVLGVLMVYLGEYSPVLLILGILWCVFSFLYLFLAFRCPHCDSILRYAAEYCPHCGKKLEK